MQQGKTQSKLRELKIDLLHLEALTAAKSHQRCEAYLLTVLEVVEEKKLYLECELTSLYQYCTMLLHLSESIAYSLIAVIRKSQEVPELKTAIELGKITLSKAKKICSVINSENQKEWIDLAAHETSRVIEKCVARANPKETVKESAQYKTADHLEFKLGVGEDWIELLKATKDLLSQKQSRAVTSEEALHTVMTEFIHRNDPVKKAERAMKRAEKKSVDAPATKASRKVEQFPGTVRRKPLKRITIHGVRLRDQNQCTHFTLNGRCNEKRWLDIHHKVPVSRGGTNDLQNLTTLCHAHHQLQHRKFRAPTKTL